MERERGQVKRFVLTRDPVPEPVRKPETEPETVVERNCATCTNYRKMPDMPAFCALDLKPVDRVIACGCWTPEVTP